MMSCICNYARTEAAAARWSMQVIEKKSDNEQAAQEGGRGRSRVEGVELGNN